MGLRQRCAVVGAVLILAACSGGGGGSLPNTGGSNGGSGGGSNPGQPQATAKQSIKFAVPIKGKARMKMTALGHQGHPDYISPATSQTNFTFDSYSGTLNLASPPSSPIDLGHGQTMTYTSEVAGDYYQVSITLTALPGEHTIGLTLLDASNNILSEATQTYNLAPGTNTNATLVLNGYLGSGFICDWPSCDGTLGSPSTASTPGQPPIYTLVAFPADIDGWVIMNQLDSSNAPVPFANGGFVIAENDGNGIVNITNPGPFTTPGTAANYNNNGSLGGPSGSWYSGYTFTLQCANVGTTTVYMYPSNVGSPPPATGLVGSNPNGPNGTQTGFGVTVTCTAGLTLIIE
ncbi:MAG: hypothetical protein ACLQPV_07195 [Vulcanimicrobiaceae bacterium]